MPGVRLHASLFICYRQASSLEMQTVLLLLFRCPAAIPWHLQSKSSFNVECKRSLFFNILKWKVLWKPQWCYWAFLSPSQILWIAPWICSTMHFALQHESRCLACRRSQVQYNSRQLQIKVLRWKIVSPDEPHKSCYCESKPTGLTKYCVIQQKSAFLNCDHKSF